MQKKVVQNPRYHKKRLPSKGYYKFNFSENIFSSLILLFGDRIFKLQYQTLISAYSLKNN